MIRRVTGRRRAVLAGIVGVSVVLCGALLTACGGSDDDGGVSTLTGSGASFPAPLYSKWASEYQKITDLQINYQAVGSGAGIEAIKAKTVEFGATDAPLSAADLEAAGLAQFPLTMGGVVLVVNVPGVADGQLKLDGAALAKIYAGTIKNWNDPALKALNPGMDLPDTAITVVHRSDSSGTTFIFTSYLSAVSSEWESQYGANKEIEWPVGVGGDKNAGVAAAVQQSKGAIGYVEYAYATESDMVTTLLKNQAGEFVQPSLEAFAAAAAEAQWDPAQGFGTILVNAPGSQSWPIAGASFILIYKDQANADEGKAMLEFFDWCYKNGKTAAESLNYVPIPDSVVQLVETMWTQEITSDGSAIWQ